MTRPALVTPALLRRLPLPGADGVRGKDDRGRVLVVGGSAQIPGAVLLAALGSLRAGAGTLQVATAAPVAPALAVAAPEARVIPLATGRRGELSRTCWRAIERELRGCDALLVGPGMMDDAAGAALARRALRDDVTAAVVLDAAALAALRGRRRPLRGARVVITPHAGEMARLWGASREAVLADPAAVARAAAARLGVVVALKGAETVIAAPDGTAFRNTAGNAGLGTSGSGDALAGIIAGLCARGADPLRAAVWGVAVHARAGDALARRVGPLGFLARELLAEVPALLHRLARG